MIKIYDVAVIGAGPSGIAAAFYAAKFGAKTVLIEKDSVIGGTAFKAYVNTLNGQSLSDMDGLLSGITKKAWNSVIFDHEALLDRYYELLKTQPVSLLTGHEAISAETDGGRITSFLCASPSGKAAVSAKVIIDATGALAVERLTGTGGDDAPAYAYMSGLVGKVETVGGKCYSAEAKRLLNEKAAWARDNSKLDRNLFIEVNPTVRADIAHVSIRYDNTGAISGNLMRRQMNSAANFLQEFGYGFENASLICSSEIFYSAQGSFNAKHTLELSDIEQNRYFNDQIASLPDGDGVGELVYYIPYGSLLSKTFENLLLCGRNIGAAANAIERIDAIPTHFETGKAAGIAAAIAVKNEIPLDEVSPYEIKSKTEDSVSDKIEVLNEELGIDEEAGGYNPDIITAEPGRKEAGSFAADLSAAFGDGEKADPENFGELDKMLELLGEDVLKPDLNTYAPGVGDFDGDDSSEPAQKDETPPEEEALEDEKSEIESIFAGLDDIAEATEGDAPEKQKTDEIPAEPAEAPDESAEDGEAAFFGITDAAEPEEPAKQAPMDTLKGPSETDTVPSGQEGMAEQDAKEAEKEAADAPEEHVEKKASVFGTAEESDGQDESEAKETPFDLPQEPVEDIAPSGQEGVPKPTGKEPEEAPIELKETEIAPSIQGDAARQDETEAAEKTPGPPEEAGEGEAAADTDKSSEQGDDQPDENRYDYFNQAFLYGDDDTPPAPEDTPGKVKGVVVFELPSEHRPPLAHKEKPKPYGWNSNPEPEEAAPVSPADEGPSAEDTVPEYIAPAEADKSIVSSDDVINMLYEEEDDITKAVRKTPAYYVPDKKMAQDDLSFLYDQDDKKKPRPKSQNRDRVDSMLDLIYEITDPSEQPAEPTEPTGEQTPSLDNPEKRKKPAENDKFKSIKDFLYDTDEE